MVIFVMNYSSTPPQTNETHTSQTPLSLPLCWWRVTSAWARAEQRRQACLDETSSSVCLCLTKVHAARYDIIGIKEHGKSPEIWENRLGTEKTPAALNKHTNASQSAGTLMHHIIRITRGIHRSRCTDHLSS